MTQFLLLILFIVSFVLFCCSVLILTSGRDVNAVVTKTRVRMCLALSVILMFWSILAYRSVELSPEAVGARIKNCMEKYPEYADRCTIPVYR